MSPQHSHVIYTSFMTPFESKTLDDVTITSFDDRTGNDVDDDVTSDTSNMIGKLGGCMILLMIVTGVAGNLLALAGIFTRKALQRSYNALIATRKALQRSYNTLIATRKALQRSYNTLIATRKALQRSYNTLIATRKALQRSYNALIASLSATDLTFNLTVMPFYADSYFRRKWIHSPALCRWHTYFGTTVVVASAFHIAAIAITRYYVIVHPVFYARWMASARAIIVQMCIVWIASIAIVLPGVVGWFPVTIDYSDQLSRCNYVRADSKRALGLVFAGGFVLPCCIMIVFYMMIWWQVRRSDLRMGFHSLSRSTATSGLVDPRRGPNAGAEAIQCAAMTTTRARQIRVIGTTEVLTIPQSSSLPLMISTTCPDVPIMLVPDCLRSCGQSLNKELTKSSTKLGEAASDGSDVRSVHQPDVATANSIPSSSNPNCEIDDAISINRTDRRPDVVINDPDVNSSTIEGDRTEDHRSYVVEDEATEVAPSMSRTMPTASINVPLGAEKQLQFLDTFAIKSFRSAEPNVADKSLTASTAAAISNGVELRSSPLGVVGDTGSRRWSCGCATAVATVADVVVISSAVSRSTISAVRHHDHLHQQHHMHSLQMILAVFLAYVITYLPFALTNLFDDHSSLGRNVYMLTSLGFWASSCVNPLIYGILNRQFRSAYISVFYACARRPRSRDRIGTR